MKYRSSYVRVEIIVAYWFGLEKYSQGENNWTLHIPSPIEDKTQRYDAQTCV